MPQVLMWAALVAATVVLPMDTTVHPGATPPPGDSSVVDDSIIMVHAPAGEPFRVDTTALPGPHLSAWWFDPSTGEAVDVGSVRRAVAVPFFPPDTGDGHGGRGWVLVIDDVARSDVVPGDVVPGDVVPGDVVRSVVHSTDPAARRLAASEVGLAEIGRR